MNTVVLIFMIVATIFALASLAYVVIDLILERRYKSENVIIREERPLKVDPATRPKREVMPEIVKHIDAEEADYMISDTLAMENAKYEKGAGHGKMGIINLGVIDAHFKPNTVITLALLKHCGLVSRKFGRIKILADGTLTKPLTIKAESYSVQAIKMIELTGGTVIILRD